MLVSAVRASLMKCAGSVRFDWHRWENRRNFMR